MGQWGRSPRRPRRLAGVVEFIEQNAWPPMTVRDVAAEANVSLRALQPVFRQHLATTPYQYLLDVRLRHVRDELSAADPATATVREIAARWGFHQSGRFAHRYKQRFGCSPGATLRRPHSSRQVERARDRSSDVGDGVS